MRVAFASNRAGNWDVYVMPLTGGGPFDTTHTMVSFLYYFGITRMRVGFGSAVGVGLPYFAHRPLGESVKVAPLPIDHGAGLSVYGAW